MAGLKGDTQDTPKSDDIVFHRCYSELVGTNVQALIAASREAEQLGYRPLILSSTGEGEAREVVKVLTAHGADRSLRDIDGDDAASFAAQQGHIQVVEYLNSLEN